MIRPIALSWVLALSACSARETAPPQRGVTILTSPNLKTWLPTTGPDADELKPCLAEEDLIVHCSWKGDGPARHIYAELHATNYPGVTTNWGKLKLADLTLEGSRNPAWTIVGKDIPEYPGIQSANIEGGKGITARTTLPVESGVVVELHVSSYDNGGSGKLEVHAENCEPAKM